jgi:hypothetical protein
MSAPLSLMSRPSPAMGIQYSLLLVKHNQAGIAELYEETQTVKQVVNGRFGGCMEPLGYLPKLSHTLVRITNLKHTERYIMDPNSIHDQEFRSVATSGIMNGCEERNRLKLSTQSAKNVCKDLNMTSRAQELRDSLREPLEVPKNQTF